MTTLKDFRRFIFFVGFLVFITGMTKLALEYPHITNRAIEDFPSLRFFTLMIFQFGVVFALRYVCYRAADFIWRLKGLPK